jgi:Tfp pilus assembly protein PilZ
MQPALEPRYRKRVPCRLRLTGGLHSGMVLNVSRRGLFVQTSASASPGDAVQLDLALGDAERLPVDARVVWRRVVAPHLRSVSTGGIGLQIQYASDAWYGYVAGLAATTPAESAASAGPGLQPSYRVRLRLAGTPRTRVVLVPAADAAEARRLARQQTGPHWAVLDLARLEPEA